MGEGLPNRRSARALLPPGEDDRSANASRILEAAVLAFAERGYHGVSVRDIAGAVGIKAASVYAHFPSKEAIVAELIVLGHLAHHAHVRDAIFSAGTDPVDQLREAVRANVWFHASYPELTIVGNSALHALGPENTGRVLRLRHDSGVLVAAVIDRGIATGAFDVEDTWLAMSAIAGMGLRVAWWFRPATEEPSGPLDTYPSIAGSWLPVTDRTPESVADAYAAYALRIVGAERPLGEEQCEDGSV